MGILPESRPPATLPFPAILLVRVSVARTAGRHDYFVRVESNGDADALFAKALREFRTLHGPVERVVAIDLHR